MRISHLHEEVVAYLVDMASKISETYDIQTGKLLVEGSAFPPRPRSWFDDTLGLKIGKGVSLCTALLWTIRQKARPLLKSIGFQLLDPSPTAMLLAQNGK